MSPSALRFEGVTRRFGAKTALFEIDLAVEPGTVLGLVGRNAAGKTTTLRLAHGRLHPDEGRVRVLGLDPVRQGLEVRRRCSLLSEEAALYPWMSGHEILDFAAALHPNWDRDLADTLVKRLDLDPRERVRGQSRGTRAKVALIVAVACRPQLLLLDDPTAGLDPLVRREILEGILESMSDGGGAVVYASHLVHDIERVADRVVFLDRGSIRLDAPLERIKDEFLRARAVFDAGAPGGDGIPGVVHASVDGRVMEVVARASASDIAAVLRAAGARDVEVGSLPLEEILVALLREEERGVDRND